LNCRREEGGKESAKQKERLEKERTEEMDKKKDWYEREGKGEKE